MTDLPSRSSAKAGLRVIGARAICNVGENVCDCDQRDEGACPFRLEQFDAALAVVRQETPMTDDIRERVARAICKADQERRRQPTDDMTITHWCEHYLPEADAALSACGYQEMREALNEARSMLRVVTLDEEAEDILPSWERGLAKIDAALAKSGGCHD